MKEIIVLQIGQGGIQVGNSCWELFCLEHNISPDGQIINHNQKDDTSKTYYSQTQAGKYAPRSLFIDLQPTVVDQIRTGTYKALYHPSNLISGKEDASNIFSRGQSTVRTWIIDTIFDRLRKQSEKCNNLEGFMLFSALGGGTGSGLGSLIYQKMSIQYNKKSYNSLLASHELIKYQDISVVLDNEALYDICSRKLHIDQPNYKNINRLIAQAVSSLTYALRFNGLLNASLRDIETNLVPYPRIRFMQSSYSPFINSQRQYFERLNSTELTNLAFDSSNIMAKCDPSSGKYIACCLSYKGDIVPSEVYSTIHSIKQKKTINFVDWCPTGFKVGINDDKPTVVPGGQLAATMSSCSMISNTTSIASVFSKINYKFDLMYAKRAFIHWYFSEGIQQGLFSQARQDLALLQKDYEQISAETVESQQQD